MMVVVCSTLLDNGRREEEQRWSNNQYFHQDNTLPNMDYFYRNGQCHKYAFIKVQYGELCFDDIHHILIQNVLFIFARN